MVTYRAELDPEEIREYSPDLLRLPAYKGKCDAEEEYRECHMNAAQIERKARDLGVLDVLDFSVTVASVKEECMKEDISALAQGIAAQYGHLKNPTHQVIERDWTFFDFFPGSTEIHYRIFTRREIREGSRFEHY